MNFQITGLPADRFVPLYALGARALAARGVETRTADAPNAYPCRVSLEDALPGEELLLLSWPHLPARGPYASSGPIFVRRHAATAQVAAGTVPGQQRRRLLSVRAYDDRDYLIDADVAPGAGLEALIERFFGDPSVSYLHVHNARHGCYACRVNRA
ncbi:MAG: DUF1203 domain-containing protein [Steroidobacteraceae bacterium]